MKLFGKYGTLRNLMASPFGPVIVASAGLGAYYLWTAHTEHVLDALIYLPLAACLLMHLFMHRGHGHGGGHGSDQPVAVRHDENPHARPGDRHRPQ